MLIRPSWQTGATMPSPPGVRWTFTPSPPEDSVRLDIQPATLMGGITQAVMPEPAYMVPTTSGLYVLPYPDQLPDLASVIRRILQLGQ